MNNQGRAKCLVLMPLAGQFDLIYRAAIQPAVEAAGLECFRLDSILAAGNVLRQIIENIDRADLLIFDLSDRNPNAFYELGIAHSLAKKVILISQKIQDIPFDILGARVILYDYDPRGVVDLRVALEEALSAAHKQSEVSSPVVDSLPNAKTVPVSEFKKAVEELRAAESRLSEREGELQSLRISNRDVTETIALGQGLKRYIEDVIGNQVLRLQQSLADANAESNRLKLENEQLRLIQGELRRLQEMTLVNPHWKGRDFVGDNTLCFLLMPFSEAWSNDVWKLIEQIVNGCGLRCERANEKLGRVIMDDIWEGICKARIIIADLTSKNPNVTYEVGLADVLGKDVILLSQNPKDVPFDFLGLRLLIYENSIGGEKLLSQQLEERIRRFLSATIH